MRCCINKTVSISSDPFASSCTCNQQGQYDTICGKNEVDKARVGGKENEKLRGTRVPAVILF